MGTAPKEQAPESEVIRKKVRSPNFPVIDLGAAITRVRELWAKDRGSSVPITVIHSRWDYKQMSGVLQQTVAALLAFGLIEVSGTGDKRQIKISEDGRKILLDHVENPQLLKELAVRPKVFGHLWVKYQAEGGIPQDDVIRQYLLFDYEFPFNVDSVDSCIGRFKDTIVYAKLTDSDIMQGAEESNGGSLSDFAAAMFGPVQKNKDSKPAEKQVFMPISSINQLASGKLSLLMEPNTVLTEDDIKSIEYQIEGFKMEIRAAGRKMAAQEKKAAEQAE